MSPDSHSVEPDMFGRVAVVMGGWSAEREVSLRSGAEVLGALQKRGVDATGIDADKNVVSRLQREKFDRVFLILHGRGGEDGHIQGALELAEIPYTGSGVASSALAMDKNRSKLICQAHGLRTANWFLVDSEESAIESAQQLGYPVIVKPVSEGSSIGVSKAMQNEVVDAYREAAKYGEVMLESFVSGMEVTAAVLGGRALPLVSMSTPNLFYDYEAKYHSDDTVYQCPVDLPEADQQRIRDAALVAFKAVGANDWGRVDFMLDAEGREHFMELNTAPGMTDHSLVPMAAREAGMSFDQLCMDILMMTLKSSDRVRSEVIA